MMKVRGEVMKTKPWKTGMFSQSLQGCIHGGFGFHNLGSYHPLHQQVKILTAEGMVTRNGFPPARE
jgi:hypothetical protein